MSSSTVRISAEAKETLRALASSTNKTMQDVLDEAVELYRRRMFLTEANAAFHRLRHNAQAWEQEKRERAAWDSTLADGLEE